MDGFLTVGQPAAAAAVHAMLGARAPQSVILVGPAGVGKASLALDLAAGLLCTGATGGARPCRACRGCRMVEHGNHPDLHLLGPEGSGGQVLIGGPDKPRGVRDLVSELSLMPVEGGARVAVIRDAHRMNEDAQNALLKTLEEPPAGATVILCADDDERLLPTIRSRCARVRLGTVDARAIEQLLENRGLADPPLAARLARLTAGRPGLAVAYASAPEAPAIRAELARRLLDLLTAGPAQRLGAAKDLQTRAGDLARLLAEAAAAPQAAPPSSGRAQPASKRATVRATDASDATDAADDAAETDDAPAGKASAADRRRAMRVLLEVWQDLARDIALVERGATRSVRDTSLLEELERAQLGLDRGAAADHLARLARAEELLEGNVTPELVLDTLLLRWPRRRRVA